MRLLISVWLSFLVIFSGKAQVLVGTDSEYASQHSVNTNWIWFDKYTAGSSGTVDTLCVYMSDYNTVDMKVLIANDSGTVLDCTAAIARSGTGPNWFCDSVNVSVTASSEYWIGVFAEGSLKIRHNNDVSTNWVVNGETWPTCPATISDSSSEDLGAYSIYGSGSAGGSVVPVLIGIGEL